jgi:hypothetical protein
VNYPFARYASYVVVNRPVEARHYLSRDGFLFLSDDDYSDFLTQLGVVPDIKRGKTKTLEKYIAEHRISWLFEEPTEAHKNLFRVLRTPVQRQVMEELLITNLPNEEVARLFTSGTRIDCDEMLVARYRHYFWDAYTMSRQDWRSFLFTSNHMPSYPNANELWTALFLPVSMVLWKMGFEREANIEKAKMLDDIMKMAYYKCMEAAHTGDVSDFKRAADVVANMYEASRNDMMDTAGIVDKMREDIQLIRTGLQVEPLQVLSGGHHSKTANVIALPKRRDTDGGSTDNA